MHLEVEGKDDRKYVLTCSPEAPLGELQDSLCSMRAVVIERMQLAIDAEIKKRADEEKKEDVEPKVK